MFDYIESYEAGVRNVLLNLFQILFVGQKFLRILKHLEIKEFDGGADQAGEQDVAMLHVYFTMLARRIMVGFSSSDSR